MIEPIVPAGWFGEKHRSVGLVSSIGLLIRLIRLIRCLCQQWLSALSIECDLSVC